MKTIKLNLYSFDELTMEAKQKALNHFRDVNLDHDWWDFIVDDFQTIAGYLGVFVQRQSIAFNGFYSQGDGSGFSATVDLRTLIDGIEKQAWKTYAPNIELPLTAPTIDRRVLKLAVNGKINIEPRIIKRNRGYSIVADFGGYPTDEKGNHDLTYGEIDNLEKWLENAGNILNLHLYKSLQEEFEFLTRDMVVEETIMANDLQFTVDGKFANRLEKFAIVTK